MHNEISEIGDQLMSDIQRRGVPGGGATIDALQSTGRVSPAANLSDGHAHLAPQPERVVRGGGATTNAGQPISSVSPAANLSGDHADSATQAASVVRRGRNHTEAVTHGSPVSSSKNRNGRKAIAGEASQTNSDTQAVNAGLSTSIPGNQPSSATQIKLVVGNGEAGHRKRDAHLLAAGLSKIIPDDHRLVETQNQDVVGGEASHQCGDTHETRAGLSVIIEEIREQWRRRQIWHRAEKSLTLQAKACCRRLVEGDKIKANALLKAAYTKCDNELAEVAFAATFPLVEAGKSVELHRKAVEKRLIKLASQLPIAEFILNLRGVGLLSLAGIIGEAGDLSAYSNPAKLWKRMGMGLVDGQRQRRVCDAEVAIKHGYSPSRRSHMWNIGSCIIKAGGPLKDLYAERKEYELTKPETASKLHAHRKAQRYIEKRLLRDMWCEWRKH
jgi:hypothetical protein